MLFCRIVLSKVLKLKKKYPDTIKLKYLKKKPIAILFNKKKFYLSEKLTPLNIIISKTFKIFTFLKSRKI